MFFPLCSVGLCITRTKRRYRALREARVWGSGRGSGGHTWRARCRLARAAKSAGCPADCISRKSLEAVFPRHCPQRGKSLSRVRLFVTPWTTEIHGILQARILEWVDFAFSSGSSWWINCNLLRLITLPKTSSLSELQPIHLISPSSLPPTPHPGHGAFS